MPDNRGLEKINGVNNFQIHKPINGNEGIEKNANNNKSTTKDWKEI